MCWNVGLTTNRKHIVDSTLCIACKARQWTNCKLDLGALTGAERCPSCSTPPGYNEAKKLTETRSTSLCGPEINRTSQRKSRADFCNDGRSDECEQASHNETRPRIWLSTNSQVQQRLLLTSRPNSHLRRFKSRKSREHHR